MPIGVPKVAYRLPGDEESHWVDLYNRLYRDRVLFLGADLDDELSNQLISIMIFLVTEDPNPDMFLYINSLGGALASGFAVYDVMVAIPGKMITTCVGTAASMASFILCTGSFGFRFALPHSRVMIHQPAGGSNGQSLDITTDSSQVNTLRRRVNYIYAEITGQTVIRILDDMNRDNYMRPSETKDYGIVDHVVKVKQEMRSLEKNKYLKQQNRLREQENRLREEQNRLREQENLVKEPVCV